MVVVAEYNARFRQPTARRHNACCRSLTEERGEELIPMTLTEIPTRWGEKLPYGGIVLPPDFSLAGEAVVEAPVRRASVRCKAVQLVRVLALEACLGAEPSKTSLPPHTIKVGFISLPNHTCDHHMHGWVLQLMYVYMDPGYRVRNKFP